MSEKVKRYGTTLCLLFLFLLVVPAVCHGAGDGSSGDGAAKDSDAGSSYLFPAGTTVESLQEELAPQGPDRILRVLKPDGSIRESGPIETGDRVEVLDETGQMLSCVTARVEESSRPSSGAASSPPVSLGQPEDNGTSVFSPGTTVESLQEELAACGFGDCTLKVKSHAGRIRGSGNICTGDALSVLDAGGHVLFGTKAVVPGDLTRCGLPTAEACDLLYDHLILRKALTGDLLDAADLNRDGSVDTSDLLQLKKAAG